MLKRLSWKKKKKSIVEVADDALNDSADVILEGDGIVGALDLSGDGQDSKQMEDKELLNRHGMIPQQGINLLVHITKAEGLCIRDTAVFGEGSSDPYVKILVDGLQVAKTHHKKKDLNPEFDQHFNVTLPQGSLTKDVTFAIFDKDMVSKDDAMGEVCYNVQDLIADTKGGSVNKTSDVLTCAGCSTASGKLFLVVDTASLAPIEGSPLDECVKAQSAVADGEAELLAAQGEGDKEEIERAKGKVQRAKDNEARAKDLLDKTEDVEHAEYLLEVENQDGDAEKIAAATDFLAAAKEAVEHCIKHDELMDERDGLDEKVDDLHAGRDIKGGAPSSGFCCW